jgi:hypothetical protein
MKPPRARAYRDDTLSDIGGGTTVPPERRESLHAVQPRPRGLHRAAALAPLAPLAPFPPLAPLAPLTRFLRAPADPPARCRPSTCVVAQTTYHGMGDAWLGLGIVLVGVCLLMLTWRHREGGY